MKGYEIPRHKCQLCYKNTGRFILDCYCVVCEECYEPVQQPTCPFCQKPTKGKKLDTKDKQTFEKVGHLFSRPDNTLGKTVELINFQFNVANRYAYHLENKINAYESAVKELIASNPKLQNFFMKRIPNFGPLVQNGSKNDKGNKGGSRKNNNNNNVHSIKKKNDRMGSGSLPGRNGYQEGFGSKQYQNAKQRSRSTANTEGDDDMFRHNRPQQQNVVDASMMSREQRKNKTYNVPNINLMTAYKSSKRPSKHKPIVDKDYRKYRKD